MKKLLMLLFIVSIFTFSVQDSNAQQRPAEIAKTKVAELTKSLELNEEQQRTLWRVLVKKEAAVAKAGATTKEIEATLDKDIKEVLTPEQYKKYQATIEK